MLKYSFVLFFYLPIYFHISIFSYCCHIFIMSSHFHTAVLKLRDFCLCVRSRSAPSDILVYPILFLEMPQHRIWSWCSRNFKNRNFFFGYVLWIQGGFNLGFRNSCISLLITEIWRTPKDQKPRIILLLPLIIYVRILETALTFSNFMGSFRGSKRQKVVRSRTWRKLGHLRLRYVTEAISHDHKFQFFAILLRLSSPLGLAT